MRAVLLFALAALCACTGSSGASAPQPACSCTAFVVPGVDAGPPTTNPGY